MDGGRLDQGTPGFKASVSTSNKLTDPSMACLVETFDRVTKSEETIWYSALDVFPALFGLLRLEFDERGMVVEDMFFVHYRHILLVFV